MSEGYESEDLATDIDIVIAIWCGSKGLGGVTWEDRCVLRKMIFDLVTRGDKKYV